MILKDFTPAQQRIIRKICIKQLDSLRRLLHNESEDDTDITMFLIKNEITQEEYEVQLVKNIEKFKQLGRNPDDLRVLDEFDLSMFRHLLTNLSETWKEQFPKAVSNLWQRLFLIEQIMESKDFTFTVN